MIETKNIAKRDGKAVYADGRVEILEYGMTEVEPEAFREKDIVSIELPNSVTKIGECAFFLSSLKEAVIPYSVKTIERRAFSACELEKITIPYGVEYIGESAFSGCESLHTVSLTKGLKIIDERAFYECKCLAKINLPEGIEKIGREAFSFCDNLSEIEIPKSVTEIEANPFRACRKLCIHIDEENLSYKLIDGSIFTADGKKIISYLGQKNEYSIPEGTEYIGEMAFAYSLLNSIKFATTVKEIGRFAFWKCRFIGVRIPYSVHSIEELAFADCNIMRGVEIEEGLYKIGNRAFDGCELLTRAVLPKTLCEVGNGIFSGCAITVYRMDIFYGGSKFQWKKIEGVESLEIAKVHYKTIFGYTK